MFEASGFVASEASAERAPQIIAKPTEDDGPDVRAIALECAGRTDGDVAEAAQELLSELKQQHPAYYANRARMAMQLWAEKVVRDAASSVRKSIAASASRTASTVKSSGATGLSINTMRSFASAFMDWPVRSGVALRNATRADLLGAVNKYIGDAKVYTSRGNWLAAIAAKLPDDSTKVGDAMSEKVVAALAAEFKVSQE